MVEIYKSDGKQLKFAVIDKMLVINKQLKQLNKVMTDKFLPPGNAWKLTWLHYISFDCKCPLGLHNISFQSTGLWITRN